MKIAVVHSFYSNASPSGENQVVLSQVDALRGAGHEVKLLAKYTDHEARRRLYPLRSAVTAAGYGRSSPLPDLARFDPDIIHVHNLFPNWGDNWLSQAVPPVVTTLHNFRTVCAAALLWRDGNDCNKCLISGSQNALRHKCYRESAVASLPLAWATRGGGRNSELLNNAKAIVTLNQRATDFFGDLRPGVEIRNIPNFASNSNVATNEEKSDAWIYVGRLVEEKGVGWLLENWPKSRKLVFVGSGPLEDKVRIAAEQEPNRFTFLGRLEQADTRQAITAAQGMVIPSLWAEGIPTVALEALQSATPILISDRCSSAADLTADGAGEIFTHETSPREFEDLINSMSDTQSYRRNARELYGSRYSEQMWLRKIEDLYLHVSSQSS